MQVIGKSRQMPESTEKGLKPHNESMLQTFDFEVITVNDQGQETNRRPGQAQYFREKLGNGVTLEMVSIPGGKFLMGTKNKEIERLAKKYNNSYDFRTANSQHGVTAKYYFRTENPQHEVTVKPFFMGKYPVTQAQWKAVASLPKIERDLDPEPSDFKGDSLPVENVSWYDAVEFCKRLSKHTDREYRLPSEAQWEYTCRAGTTTPFYFGETITSELANYRSSYIYGNEPKGEYREKTTTVGSFPPNAFGLYDMHGNLWEWCADYWHQNYKGAPTDGSPWLSDNDHHSWVLRGGSWYDYPGYCRSASRFNPYPVIRDYNFGFRVCCGIPRTL